MSSFDKEVETYAKTLLPHCKLFIDGEFIESKSGKRMEVIHPATEKVFCTVSEGDSDDIELAVQAAERALKGEWGNMDPSKRQELLFKLAEEWDKQVEELAQLESLNNGSPIATSRYVIKGLTDTWKYNAGWIDKLGGRVCVTDKKFHVYTKREPLGVIGVISPWNLPMWCSLVNIAPAIAMGNCVILKPAEQTPLTALKLAEIMQKVGIPKGVYNVVTGYGPTAGNAIVKHMRISKVAFTGSTQVGRNIMKGAAESNLKQVHLELGGKSPVVVFGDANIDEAVQLAAFAVFNNNGQICTAGSRTYVHESIYDKFVEKASQYVSSFKVGFNLDETNNFGPLVNKMQYDKVKQFIEIGKKEGAKLIAGGDFDGLPQKGYFVKPTVFANVTDSMTIGKEEIFGPVQSILKWKDIDDVIERCNASPYGLAAAIFTKNIDNMFLLSDKIKAGTVWVNNYHNVLHNAEFGGYKQSGFGREGGEEGVKAWTTVKTVVIQLQSNL
ncbi:hypothetical protein ABK040_007267 [Willaertia magna]